MSISEHLAAIFERMTTWSWESAGWSLLILAMLPASWFFKDKDRR
jgi:hypothetical protein